MILELNKTYKTRNGIKVENLKKVSYAGAYNFEAVINDPKHKSPSILQWKKNGRYISNDIDHYLDIIE